MTQPNDRQPDGHLAALVTDEKVIVLRNVLQQAADILMLLVEKGADTTGAAMRAAQALEAALRSQSEQSAKPAEGRTVVDTRPDASSFPTTISPAPAGIAPSQSEPACWKDDRGLRDDLAASVLIALAEKNIPTDIQELLVNGDPQRGIAPGALSKACAIIWHESMRCVAERNK